MLFYLIEKWKHIFFSILLKQDSKQVNRRISFGVRKEILPLNCLSKVKIRHLAL